MISPFRKHNTAQHSAVNPHKQQSKYTPIRARHTYTYYMCTSKYKELRMRAGGRRHTCSGKG